ncbi:hypothetical protein PUN28_011546 [Cardiocondyla obscurior]|uniref:Ribosomal protein S19 n=1 Tax=Cardiocondyla obscurior TaxID=286306 RepID=A0AAW2FK84_9HYME
MVPLNKLKYLFQSLFLQRKIPSTDRWLALVVNWLPTNCLLGSMLGESKLLDSPFIAARKVKARILNGSRDIVTEWRRIRGNIIFLAYNF